MLGRLILWLRDVTVGGKPEGLGKGTNHALFSVCIDGTMLHICTLNYVLRIG